MQGLLSSLADKAQSALNQTPLGRTNSQQGSQGGQSSAAGGILKSHAFESIHHQFRSLQQQYSSSVTPVQKIITTQKGLALDFDSVGRDAHAHSKELYAWGQAENEDLKDVSDRLAWMAYIEGSLALALAKGIDASRTPVKALRDAENAISGRRNIRAGLENQIARIEHEQRHGMDQKLAELKRQLRKVEEDDGPLEKEIELLKRKGLRESEIAKWNAIREYAEKLSLVSQAAIAAIPALPDIPSSKERPYNGAQLTASVRTTLQQALDQWKVGDTALQLREPTAADLTRSDTRSFGVTHAQELARINSVDPHAKPSSVPITPPPTGGYPPQVAPHSDVDSPPSSTVLAPSPPPTVSPSIAPTSSASPPLNPAQLNQAPAPIPVSASASPAPIVSSDRGEPVVKIPAVTPTVAETGLPKVAGREGPGPSSGSLKDIKHDSSVSANSSVSATASGAGDLADYTGAAAAPPVGDESAEEEKRRLEREERERVLREGGSASAAAAPEKPKYESAEEEKKRLEREERERLLGGGPSKPNPDSKQGPLGPGNDADADAELPPYQEF